MFSKHLQFTKAMGLDEKCHGRNGLGSGFKDWV